MIALHSYDIEMMFAQNDVISTEVPLSDKTKPLAVPPRVVQRLTEAYGVQATHFDVAVTHISIGREALSAFTGMDRISTLVGDVQPNKADIHLKLCV